MSRVEQFVKVQEEGKKLFEQKNQDYGDAFSDYGVVGVLVRMGDKIKRLQSITSNGINVVKNESLRDTLIDLHNYAGMAIMLMDENKVVDIEKGEVEVVDIEKGEVEVVDIEKGEVEVVDLTRKLLEDLIHIV